jgi:hypothetical protein
VDQCKSETDKTIFKPVTRNMSCIFWLRPRTSTIKLFNAVFFSEKEQTVVSVTVKHCHPSLIFVSKAESAPLRVAVDGVA